MLRMATGPVAKVSFVSNRPTSFILGCRQESSKLTEKIQTKQYLGRQSGKSKGTAFPPSQKWRKTQWLVVESGDVRRCHWVATHVSSSLHCRIKHCNRFWGRYQASTLFSFLPGPPYLLGATAGDGLAQNHFVRPPESDESLPVGFIKDPGIGRTGTCLVKSSWRECSPARPPYLRLCLDVFAHLEQ